MAVTKVKQIKLGTGLPLVEYEGESTDRKPTSGCGFNSKFTELDTGKKFYFDGTEWKALKASEGGSGGGGSDGGGGSASVEQFVIAITTEPDQQNEGQLIATSDKTYAEVAEAYDDGALLVASIVSAVDGESVVESVRVPLASRQLSDVDENQEPLYQFIFRDTLPGFDLTITLDSEGVSAELTEAAQPSGGGEPLVVTCTTQDGETFTGNKTAVEIYEAKSVGTPVVLVVQPESNITVFCDIVSAMHIDGEGYEFSIFANGPGSIAIGNADANNAISFSL